MQLINSNVKFGFVSCCVTDEFCEEFPHNLIPTPGYWVECSRQKISAIGNTINVNNVWDEHSESGKNTVFYNFVNSENLKN